MSVNLIFKIAAVGILVSVLSQVDVYKRQGLYRDCRYVVDVRYGSFDVVLGDQGDPGELL